MHYVYLLRSESEPLQRYIGLTDDLRARLAHLNSGAYPHRPAKRHYFPVPKYPPQISVPHILKHR